MNKNDLKSFAQLLDATASLYNKKLTPQLTELYWHALIKFEWVQVKQAVEAHVANPDRGQIMPKPADIIQSICGDSRGKALAAWRTVEEQLRKVGCYSTPVFPDPLTHQVIQDLGGWLALCRSMQCEMRQRYYLFEKFFQQRLREHYDRINQRTFPCVSHATHGKSCLHTQHDHLV